MRKCLILVLVLFAVAGKAQSSLFDDSKVSSVYIEIDPDSLAYIYANVLSDHYFRSRFIFNDGVTSDTLNDVGFRLRGNTSRFSAKKSFKISFNEYVPGRRYQEVKKINLNGQHNDPTLIREKLFYDLWAKIGLPERRSSFVRVYINQTYYGLYTNLEELDKDWLQRVFPENDGNLYKCTYPADLVYLDDNQQSYKNIFSSAATGGRAYDLQTNEAEDDYTDLVDLVRLLDSPADSVFADSIISLLDVDEVLKAFAFDVASGNWDDYMYNKNNYFLYHNLSTGRFEFISYDTDNTFGVDWFGQDWATRNCMDWLFPWEPRPLAEKLLAVPAFRLRYQCYLDTIARDIILPDSVFPHIDNLKNLITDAVSEDYYRTLDYGYDMNDFFNGFNQEVDPHTPYGIKPFLTLRSQKILEQIQAYGIPEDSYKHNLSVFPNPVGQVLNFELPPGTGVISGFISDISGRRLIQFKFDNTGGNYSLYAGNLKPGFYFLNIFDGRDLFTTRFIKR